MNSQKSWEVKEKTILDDLIHLIDLTPAEVQMLVNLQEQAQAIAPALSEAFYRRLMHDPFTVEYLGSQIDARKKTLEMWFAELFSGKYDQDYVQRRLSAGQSDESMSLSIRYPLVMIDLILEHAVKVTAESAQPDQAMRAFRKLLALDVAIFDQAYEDVRLKHLAATLGNERSAHQVSLNS